MLGWHCVYIVCIMCKTYLACFLKHDFVFEVLHEVKWHDCMIMKCKEYELWNMMQCYAHQNACQEWNDIAWDVWPNSGLTS